jgi:hypothetical protein
LDVGIRERLVGPRVSDEAFLDEVARTPGVWPVRSFGAKQNISSRRQNLTKAVVVIPGLALLVAHHPLGALCWVFATAMLILQPVTLQDYRRIRRAAAARRGEEGQPPSSG